MLLAAAFAAHAAAPLAHDTTGRAVVVTEPTVLVCFSVHTPAPLDAVAELRERGIPVVLVDEDAASETALVRPFLAARGLTLPVVYDPTGELARRFAVPGQHGAAVVDGDLRSLATLPSPAVTVDAVARLVDDTRVAGR